MKNVITLLMASAFANAGWKMDADGKIELKDGNPVWIDANGGERVMNGDTIARLNGEAATLRQRAEQAETKLATFKDIADPAKAIEAMNKLKDIDQSKLIDSGKLDQVRQEITAQFTTQLTEKDNALKSLQSSFDSERISNIFASSEFIRDRIAMPREFFESAFRGNFKIEEGKVVVYDKSGNRVMSEKNIGDYADPNEALELLVSRHPQKDAILKAHDANGSGTNGNGNNRGGGRIVKRSDFDKMNPQQQADAAGKMRTGEIQIVD